MIPVIESLHIYPLKSAQGLAVEEITIDSSGPQYDREWMLIDKNNSFISQRTKSEMSQIQTELTTTNLIVNAPNMQPLAIALSNHGSQEIDVKLFQKITPAHLLNKEYDQWFSEYLSAKVRLIRSPQRRTRETSGNHGPKTELKYADGYPFLLTNTATLEELNSKLETPVTMSRFRPNIVINNTPKNEEESWKAFKINNVHFLSVKSCKRCVIINVDPATGKKTAEVTRTLSNYRTKDGAVIFGNNLSHSNTGSISAGDQLLV